MRTLAPYFKSLRDAVSKVCARLLSLRRNIAADTRGGTMMIIAFAMVPLIGFIGIGNDTARAYIVKSRLSAALDAAALVGGKNFFEPTRDDTIRMIFETNFPTGYMDATVSGPDIVADDANEIIHLSASATVPTSLMRLLGHDSITVAAEAEVTRKMTALDVVLSIDVSGSMGGSAPGEGTRIAAAKSAATDLVNILFGSDISKDLLKIGLVPWSSKVNVMTNGQAFDPAATRTEAVSSFTNPETGQAQSVVYYVNNSHVPLLLSPPAGWRGCVFNRYVHNTTDDEDGDIRYGAFSGGGKDWPAWAPVFPGDDAEHPGVAGEPVSGGTKCLLAGGHEECTACPSPGITPLQNQKSVILNAINALSATGNTNIPAGLAWAWRVLMPDPPFTQADPDPEFKRDQAIVLMTDGENCAASGDGYKRVFGGCGSTSRKKMDDRVRKLAAAVKADGVLVYVIQFANEGTELQSLLKEVASGPDTPYYYYAPTADDLHAAFREIANHLSELRVSK